MKNTSKFEKLDRYLLPGFSLNFDAAWWKGQFVFKYDSDKVRCPLHEYTVFPKIQI